MARKKKVTAKNIKARNTKERVQRIIIFGVTLLLLIVIWQERRFIYKFEGLGYFGLFAFNVLANATVFVPLPAFISVFVSGAIWNPVLVGLVSGIGSAIGELVGFFLGYGGRGIINNLYGKKSQWVKRIEKWFQRSGFLTILFASAFPDPIFDLVGILAGTMNYSIIKFFLATIIGRSIRNIIIAWSGAKIIP